MLSVNINKTFITIKIHKKSDKIICILGFLRDLKKENYLRHWKYSLTTHFTLFFIQPMQVSYLVK